MILAKRALQPIKDEIAHRKKEAARIEVQEAECCRTELSHEDANAICERAAFTPNHLQAR